MGESKVQSLTNKNLWKFLLCSALGIFVFFIQVTIGEHSRIPVDHLIALLKTLLKEIYPYLILLLIAAALFSRLRQRDHQGGMFFLVQSALGLGITGAFCLELLPASLAAVVQSAVDATGNILCAIFLTSVFVPLLTEYGLVDFVGVFFRPIMRKVFLTPGSSAVIGVSAFLGNYSMGHVLSRKMYERGQFTEKEAVIVSVGFSTCSIGLMINLVNYLGLMPLWNVYVLDILLVTFATTIIIARIPPVRWKKDSYAPGVEPKAEAVCPKQELWREATRQALEKAQASAPFLVSVKDMFIRVIPVICEITGTSMFVITLALLLKDYTPVFSWIGSLFLPVLRLCGLGSQEAYACTLPLGACLFEPVLSGVITQGMEFSFVAKWIIAIVPYSSIIFFAGFIPSLWKSGIPCRIWEMLLIWVERMVVGICLSALSAWCIGILL